MLAAQGPSESRPGLIKEDIRANKGDCLVLILLSHEFNSTCGSRAWFQMRWLNGRIRQQQNITQCAYASGYRNLISNHDRKNIKSHPRCTVFRASPGTPMETHEARLKEKQWRDPSDQTEKLKSLLSWASQCRQLDCRASPQNCNQTSYGLL